MRRLQLDDVHLATGGPLNPPAHKTELPFTLETPARSAELHSAKRAQCLIFQNAVENYKQVRIA